METLVLSQKTTSGLLSLNIISDDALVSVCRYVLQSVCVGSSSIPVDNVKDETLAAVTTLLLESAKVRATREQVKSLLLDNGVKDSVTSALIELYDTHSTPLINHMELTGIASPEIVGIEWRLDYSCRSKHGGKINLPLFFVTLKIKEGNGDSKDVNIIATREELLDMLSKVKDAVKQVERVLNMNDS